MLIKDLKLHNFNNEKKKKKNSLNLVQVSQQGKIQLVAESK